MKRLNCSSLLISLILFASTINAASHEQIQSWIRTYDNYLVISEPLKLGELDPTKSINAHTKFILPLIFESLITVNAQQELKPVLAKSWHITADNKSIIIKLKPNHRFSDNTEVTAIDVLHSVQRLCSRHSQEHAELQGLKGCTEYEKTKNVPLEAYVIDKYTIKFNINASPTTFLYQLSSPSTVITKQTKNGLIGSGVYLVKQKKIDYLILAKNPFYQGDVISKNQGIILFYAPGADLIKLMLNERPDGALMYRIEDIKQFKNDGYKLIKSNSNITEILVLNNQRFPFNQLLARKALANEIYNVFYYSCIPGARKAYGIIPTGIGGSINNMPPSSLPEVTPKQLFLAIPELKRKHTEITIHQLFDQKNDCVSDQIINAAKKYHIDIKFNYHKDYSDLLPLQMNHRLDGFLDLYIFKNREAYKIFQFFAKNGENDANISQSNIDDMLKEAITAPSSHGRFQIYKKLAQYIQDNNIVVPIFYMDHGNLMNRCLTGISEDFFFNPFLHLPQISKTTQCNVGKKIDYVS